MTPRSPKTAKETDPRPRHQALRFRAPNPPAVGKNLRCCAKCGEPAPGDGNACPKCGAFLPSNAAARTHGLFARRLPEDLRTSVEEWRADVIVAQGGLDELEGEPLRAGLVRSLVNTEVGERLLMEGILRLGGIETRAGQRLYDRLLMTVDRKLRLTVTLGLSRRQKALPSISEYLASRTRDDRP